MDKKIIVTTSFDIPGRQIKEILGIVRGNTVRSRNIGRDIAAGLKNIVASHNSQNLLNLPSRYIE